MLKTTFKIFALFLVLVIVAVSTGLATYNITKNILENDNVTAATTSSSHSKETSNESLASSQPAATDKSKFEYYLVRLEGETLEIYVSHGGTEEFLYSKEVYRRDLSVDDLKMLSRGVKLQNASELTGFIENFTS